MLSLVTGGSPAAFMHRCMYKAVILTHMWDLQASGATVTEFLNLSNTGHKVRARSNRLNSLKITRAGEQLADMRTRILRGSFEAKRVRLTDTLVYLDSNRPRLPKTASQFSLFTTVSPLYNAREGSKLSWKDTGLLNTKDTTQSHGSILPTLHEGILMIPSGVSL